MAWQKRGSYYYYYRSTKHRGKVTTDYLGSGPRALHTYEDDRQRQEAKTRERAIRQRVDALNAETQALCQQMTTLTRAVYTTQGYYQHHRGEWRKRRTPT